MIGKIIRISLHTDCMNVTLILLNQLLENEFYESRIFIF